MVGSVSVSPTNHRSKILKIKSQNFLISKANLPHASNHLYGNYTVFITIS